MSWYLNIVVTNLHLNRPDEAKATGLKANALHLDSTFFTPISTWWISCSMMRRAWRRRQPN